MINDFGIDKEIAFTQIINLLNKDIKPNRNLISFVTTEMDEFADLLIKETLSKNLANTSIYTSIDEIQNRIITAIANLLNANIENNNEKGIIGKCTIGSSESIFLTMLIHKHNWIKRNKYKQEKPHFIIGNGCHSAWEKIPNYIDIQGKFIEMQNDNYVLTGKKIKNLIQKDEINENTAAICLVLGTTLTGLNDEIEEINFIIEKLNNERQWNIPIHIDAAIGGFVIPFLNEKIAWDFNLSQIQSINLSNHKFGFVYSGLGTLIFRNKRIVPDELFNEIYYLNDKEQDFGINFTRNSFNVIVQYYNFLTLGKNGYENKIREIISNAKYLSEELIKRFDNFSLISNNKLFPNVVIKHNHTKNSYSVFDISEKIKNYGWVIASYNLPDNVKDVQVIRIVVRDNFNQNEIDLFLSDLEKSINELRCK